jgi:hypothetical protein
MGILADRGGEKTNPIKANFTYKKGLREDKK